MQIDNGVHLIGSGRMGFDLTEGYDCNVYLFESSAGAIVFDTGAGIEPDQILEICRGDGISPQSIGHLFLTHAHADHAGGAHALREATGATVYASQATAAMLSSGDEAMVSLPGARAAGIYPAAYRYTACPVDTLLADDSEWRFGDLTIRTIFTPGHSHDHCSFLVTRGARRWLVGGDAIFFGGKIVLQKSYDCDVPKSIASIERLATLEFDALLAGHLNFSLRNGMRHVRTAMDIIAQFGCPQAL